MCQSWSCICFNVLDSGNAGNGCVYICLARDPCGFKEEGGNGGGSADAATFGPALCGGVVDSCCYVLQWRHFWGEKVEVVDVCLQLQVIDG